MTSRESDSESQYIHDPLGTDHDLTEDEREMNEAVQQAYMRKAMVHSEALTSAKLVESVQVRESHMTTRREEEVRERQHAAARTQHGFDVTVRTREEEARDMQHAAARAQHGFDVTVRTREEEARQIQHARAQHGFDVTLRTSEPAQLGYSDEDTMSMSEYPAGQEPIEPVFIQRGQQHLSQHMSQHSSREQHMSAGHTGHHVSKFDVLIRVLDAPPPGASGGASTDRDDLTSVFSEDDKQKWRDIVTHDTTFRTMIESAQSCEEVEKAVSQMRYVSKYEKMFEPHKWDVIVRVLKAPGSISGKSASSKSMSTYRAGTEAGTEYDLRSVAETTVDFGVRRSEFDSGSSVSGRSGRYSAHHSTGARSMADRSGTEITEYHSYMYAESQGTSGRSESRPSYGHLTSDEQDREEF